MKVQGGNKKWTLKQQPPGFETQVFENEDLHPLEPLGISIGPDSLRPILLLKSTLNSQILPVGLSPLEAGITLGQSTQTQSPIHTHRVLQDLLGTLGWSMERAVFCEIKGPHQKVKIYFSNKKGSAESLELVFRADEAMSVCLHLSVPLFAPMAFIRASRELTSDLTDLALGLSGKPGMLTRKHIYMQ